MAGSQNDRHLQRLVCRKTSCLKRREKSRLFVGKNVIYHITTDCHLKFGCIEIALTHVGDVLALPPEIALKNLSTHRF